jgi:hypothetical protein
MEVENGQRFTGELSETEEMSARARHRVAGQTAHHLPNLPGREGVAAAPGTHQEKAPIFL